MSAKQKRQRFWRCAWRKNEYDDFGRYAYCENEKCSNMECNCRTLIVMKACPYFKKTDDKGVLLEVTDEDQCELAEYENRLVENFKHAKDLKENEERMLYEYLKRKYEGK